jgi:peptidoglycan hydrolase CwlO-like protein
MHLRHTLLIAGLLAIPLYVSAQTSAGVELRKIDTEISDKQQEIAAINKKIAELDKKRGTTAAEADAIAVALERLKASLRKAELELDKTTSAVKRVQIDQRETKQESDALQEEISQKRTQLTSLLRQLYSLEQESLVRIFFDSKSLSDVLASRDAYESLQENAVRVISEMHQQQDKLQEQQQQLEQQEQDLGELQQLLDAQAKDLALQRTEQRKFLQEKQEKQAQYEQLIAEAQAAREEIKQQIFTLESGKVKVSLKTATDMAKFAGSVTGVRPALIMAVLKVETNVGTNLGSGVFPDDMHPGSRDAFLRITKKLGLDPQKAPISRRPRSMKGWGGAMGPAQVLPATWESIEGRIEQLMKKKPVNPYELSDAFVATAVFLADRGAANKANEYEAVNRYIAGPNWQYYTWYGDKVLAVAKEYEQQGL